MADETMHAYTALIALGSSAISLMTALVNSRRVQRQWDRFGRWVSDAIWGMSERINYDPGPQPSLEEVSEPNGRGH